MWRKIFLLIGGSTILSVCWLASYFVVGWIGFNFGRVAWCTPDKIVVEKLRSTEPIDPAKTDFIERVVDKPVRLENETVTAYYNNDPTSHELTFRYDGDIDGAKYKLCYEEECWTGTVLGRANQAGAISMSRNFFEYFADLSAGKIKISLEKL